ncbi:MarR family transcriptional regulator [Nocardia sp. NPDC003693]
MPLTETQATVLAALATVEPARTLTIRQLCEKTGFTRSSTGSAVKALAVSGLARSTQRSPAGWRITYLGESLIRASAYSDFREPNLGGDAA